MAGKFFDIVIDENSQLFSLGSFNRLSFGIIKTNRIWSQGLGRVNQEADEHKVGYRLWYAIVYLICCV